jgi:cytochrome c-type biogenesis protein CcmH/NrfG
VSSNRTAVDKRRLAILSGTLVVLALAGSGVWLNDQYTRARWREATLPELETEARQRPREPYLHAQLALRQLEAHLHGPASESLQSAISNGLSTVPVWKTLAAATAAAGNPNGALGALKLGARDPQLAPTLEPIAKQLAGLGPDATVETFAQTIAPEGIALLDGVLKPNFLSSWLEQQGRKNPDQAGFETLEAWFAKESENRNVRLAWAKALARNRRYPDAEEILIPLLKKNPEDYDAALALADVRYDAGVIARAGILYRACLKDRPDDFRAAYGTAKCAVDVKLVYLGVEAATKATQLKPDSADAWVMLGRAYFNQKLRWDKAVDAFAKARKLAPERTDYFAPYYDSLRANNRIEEGAELLRKRLKEVPDDAQVNYLLAAALLEMRSDQGSSDEAEKLLRKSLASEPNVPSTRARLSQLLLEKSGQEPAKEAVGLLEQAVMLDNYHALSRRLLARAYRRTGMTEAAESVEKSAKMLDSYIKRKTPLEDAEAANPTDPEIHRKLAKIYRDGGELDKAERADQMVFLLKNRKEDAEKGLKTLMNATSLSASTEWTEDAKRKGAKQGMPEEEHKH